ncbi:MAG: hypothetical protein ACXV1K_04525 [Kineosporiaceae bacterium]
MGELILGSTAQHILLGASCSVLASRREPAHGTEYAEGGDQQDERDRPEVVEGATSLTGSLEGEPCRAQQGHERAERSRYERESRPQRNGRAEDRDADEEQIVRA